MIARWMRTVAMCGLLGTGITAALAAPQHPHHKVVAAPKCPVCKMALSAKKDKVHTVPVKVAGKTYYCCAQCNMKGHMGAGAHSHAASHLHK